MDTQWASLIFLASRQFWVLSQSLCRPNETLEVVKEKADNAFTCTYLPSNVLILWNLKVPNLSPQPELPISICDNSTKVCELIGYEQIFSANITDTKSVINANTVSLNPGNSFLFERGILICETRTAISVPGPRAECQLDYIYPAEGTCSIQFSSETWSTKGHCIIMKASSARSRYYCEWYLIHSSLKPEFVNTTSMIVWGNGPNVSGTCSFNGSLPEKDGQYKYTVILYPGKVNVSAIFNGSNEIRRPIGPINHTCTKVILEGQDLDCTCFTNDFGSPPGWLQWNNTGSARLRLTNVTEKDSGKIYNCQMVWKNNSINFTTFIINVFYGPIDAVIFSNDTMPFDTNGTRSISFLCNVSGSNPKPQITWSWSSNISDKYNGDTLTYKPNPPKDDGANIRCIARNEITNKSVTANVSVSLNYPPDTKPTISTVPALSPNEPFYLNDTVSMTCSIVGGKPSSSTVVRFICQDMSDMPDVLGPNHVNSTLQFDRISTGNQGLCQCSAQWKQYDWYTLRAEWSVVVYTPPSPPAISVPNNTVHQFPFLAGTSGRLQCKSDNPGYPTANYSWLEVSGGQANGGNLTFNNLTRDHDGANVTCRASNDFTIKRRPVGDAHFVLSVYYPPVITFSSEGSESSDACSETSLKQWQCVVTEGHEARIRCNAASNPSPATFIWDREDERNVSISELMIILNADHNIHNGRFNCTVTTSTENSDSRLPLFAWKHMFMLVKYQSVVLQFSLNDMNATLVVEEKTPVLFSCLAQGRPLPSMRIFNGSNDTLNYNSQGEITVEDQTSVLNFSFSSAPCEAAGRYFCVVHNGVGKEQWKSVELFVKCSPRGLTSCCSINEEDKYPSVNYRIDSDKLVVNMTAYPTPWLKSVYYVGLVYNETIKGLLARQNIVSSVCAPTNNTEAYSKVTCTILVSNITSSDAGFYEAYIGNELGNISFIFEVKVNVETTTSAAEVTTSHGHHDITCTESRMEFSIPLSSPHTSETATLSDPNCPINVTRTHVRGGVDLNSCGTTVQFQNDSVIFRNAIIFSAPESSSLGSSGSNSSVSQYQDIIPIQCVYNRIATVHLSYMPVVRRVLFTESGVGQFSFNIQQFWDASFTNMVSDGAYPLRMELDADVFIQLSVGSEGQPVAGHKEIGMEVQQCLVSPSSSVIEAQLHYYPLIQDGCPASSDVHIIPNTNASDSTVMRFRFRAVNFFDPSSSSSSSLVFVHCRMGLCLTGSCKPSAWSCLTPPARRVRRDVDQSKRAAHQLSTGPFLIMADEASTSSSSTTATVMAVVSTSVATVAIVIAAIALIALRRRRTTERN